MTPEQQKAVQLLFLQYGRGVGSFVQARVADAELAEEITARVFLTVVRRYDQLRDSAVGWLWAIVRTELARHFRERNQRQAPRHPGTFSERSVEQPEDLVEQHETQTQLQDALARLSQEQQQIVGMKFFFKMRNQEIAMALGMTPSNVGVIIHRALKELRDMLERHLSASVEA